MKFSVLLSACLLMSGLVSVAMAPTKKSPPPKKAPPPKRSPPPPPPPKVKASPPPKASPSPAPAQVFPAVSPVGCFSLVKEATGTIGGALDTYTDTVLFQDCMKYAINNVTAYFAVTVYGECSLVSKLSDYDESGNITSFWATQVADARCDAPCVGKTAAVSSLQCGALGEPDKGNLASVYVIDFNKVQAIVSTIKPACPRDDSADGPVAPAIYSGKFWIAEGDSAKSYLGWDVAAGVSADSIVFSVPKASNFTYVVEKRSLQPCSTTAYYVWLTALDASGKKLCLSTLDDTYMWEPCAAGSESQLYVLRALPLTDAKKPVYEVQTKFSGLCLYPLTDAAFSFTCGERGARLKFIPAP